MDSLRLALLAVFSAAALSGQTDWPAYGNDPGGTKYSPLNQINSRNAGKLTRVWTYRGDKGGTFEVTPVVAGGMMYLSTSTQRVVALNPETGTEIWGFDPKVPRAREHRGVSYWPGDARTPPRVILATSDGRLFALDAKVRAAIRVPSICAPGRWSGGFTPFRNPVSPATRHGDPRGGRIVPAPVYGRASPWMSSAGWSSVPWAIQPIRHTAAAGREPISTPAR
jgi:outer membrane protein assembly factor BamB